MTVKDTKSNYFMAIHFMKLTLFKKIFLFIFYSSFCLLAQTPVFSNNNSAKPLPHKQDNIKKANLIVSGTVVKREEHWDRRTNPLMGRPDILKEIIFHIEIQSVIRGKIPKDQNTITAVVKTRKILIRFKGIPEKKSGLFELYGTQMPFELLDFKPFEPEEPPPDDHLNDRPAPVKPPTHINLNSAAFMERFNNMTDDEFLNELEKTNGRIIILSNPLRKKALQVISKKYNMKNPKVIFLRSFQGPRPPRGGYLMWGVRGQINGKWYTWQPGEKEKPHAGKNLINHNRHQK